MGCDGTIRVGRSLSALPTTKDRNIMDNVLVIQPLVALIAGILILIMPRLLNYVVALYLILVGVLGLWPQLATMGG
jgi:hypothetical protein